MDRQSSRGTVGTGGTVASEPVQRPRKKASRRNDDATLALLRAAIESLEEAFLLCDTQDRVVLFNRRFGALADGVVVAGQTYEHLLRAMVGHGCYPEAAGQEARWIETRLATRAGGGGSVEMRAADRWYLFKEHRAPDGAITTIGVDISARKEAETGIAASEARFRAIFEQASVGIGVRTLDGRWLQANRKLCEILGYTLTELLATSSGELTPIGERAEAVDLNRRMARGEIVSYVREKRYVRKDGALVWVNLSVRAVPDSDGDPGHVLSIIEDISSRKAAEIQARLADERLRAGLENLKELIVLTDADDRIVLANRSFVEMNAPVAEYVARGRHYSDHLRAGIELGLFPDAAGHAEAWLAERMAMRHRPRGPIERRRQDGRWLLVEDQPLPDGGVISFGLEITARKNAEEALLASNADLERRVNERTAALETAYRELEAFSYSVSHDLRAPLRAISGFSSLLREEEGDRLSAAGLRHLDTIDESARRMGRLTDSLLALARTSRHKLSYGRIDMTAIARSVVDELRVEYPSAEVTVAILPTAHGDETLVRQIYANLIGNALKYSVKAACPLVEVGAERDGGATTYFVRDNGAGFDMTYVERLFRPFERLHNEAEFKGAGIGLALTHLIVERHGGRIRAEGAPGAGAIFRFTLGRPPATAATR